MGRLWGNAMNNGAHLGQYSVKHMRVYTVVVDE